LALLYPLGYSTLSMDSQRNFARTAMLASFVELLRQPRRETGGVVRVRADYGEDVLEVACVNDNETVPARLKRLLAGRKVASRSVARSGVLLVQERRSLLAITTSQQVRARCGCTHLKDHRRRRAVLAHWTPARLVVHSGRRSASQ
jgi:hypothetical protein